jgi:hypothetical protein
MRSKLFIAVMLTALCVAGGCTKTPPSQAEPLPQNENGNFVLYVSNQSFDVSPVDIRIQIDGKEAVSSDFAVGNQHNWVQHTFQLAAGKHRLVAVSRKGKAQVEEEFEIIDKHWAVVDYWCPDPDGKAQISFTIHDQPIGFM